MSQIHTEWWLRWLLQARTQLIEHRALLNRINVFPVADADTGSNMVTTLGRAADTAGMADEPTLTLAARAALRGARGNSGTLLSVWLLGFASYLAEAGQDAQAPGPAPEATSLTPTILAGALKQAAAEARAALSHPAEGTMLTLIDQVGHQEPSDDWGLYISQLLEASETALRATAQASHAHNGWVDSGALGFHLILLALATEILGTQPPQTIKDLLTGVGASTPATSRLPPRRSAHQEPYQVEIMCSIHLSVLEAAQLRSALDAVGDSVSIAQIEAGNEALWAVHVHVAQANDALTILQAAGQPQDVRISPLTDSHHTHETEE